MVHQKNQCDLSLMLASPDWDALIYQYKHCDAKLFFRNFLNKKGLQAHLNYWICLQQIHIDTWLVTNTFSTKSVKLYR